VAKGFTLLHQVLIEQQLSAASTEVPGGFSG